MYVTATIMTYLSTRFVITEGSSTWYDVGVFLQVQRATDVLRDLVYEAFDQPFLWGTDWVIHVHVPFRDGVYSWNEAILRAGAANLGFVWAGTIEIAFLKKEYHTGLGQLSIRSIKRRTLTEFSCLCNSRQHDQVFHTVAASLDDVTAHGVIDDVESQLDSQASYADTTLMEHDLSRPLLPHDSVGSVDP